MSRYARDSALLAKIEAAYGVAETLDPATDAVLCVEANFDTKIDTVTRDLMGRPYFGAVEHLPGDAWADLSFAVELAGSGTAGTAPAWGKLLRACGFAEVITPAVPGPGLVEYNPITNGQESLTVKYHDSGVKHLSLGTRGNLEGIALKFGERPKFSFKLMGIDGGIDTEAALTIVETMWKKPQIVTAANTGDLLLGCTYAAGALTGGTAYSSQGLEIAAGAKVETLQLSGGNSVDITDRDGSAKVAFDVSAAQEVAFMAQVKAATTISIGMLHGTTAGNKVLVYAPAAQLTDPKKTNVKGRRLISYDLRLLPVNGNDELIIATL